MISVETRKYRYYTIGTDSTFDQDAVLSLGHLHFGKGDKHPLNIFPENRLFLEHGGRSLKYYQLVYIISGAGWFKNSNITRKVRAGTFFLIRPGVWHSYAPDSEVGWESYYVEFSGPVLSNLVERLIPGIENDFICFGRVEEIISLYEKMLDVASADDSLSQLSLRAYTSLLVTMVASFANPAKEDRMSDRARINAVINYLEDNLSKNLDIPEIATSFNFSYSHFRRVFKAMTGVSPMDFLKNLRIQKSKQLLLTTNLLVKQVAMKCGYASGEYFCNAFLQEVGKTPSEYRNSKE